MPSAISLYFDYAAATPMDRRVLDSMLPFFTEDFYNPSSPYANGVNVKRQYKQAKDRLAHIFGASGDEIVMTAGATESINLAIDSFSGHKICIAIEHDSVLNSIKRTNHTIVPVDKKGRVNLDSLKQSITDETDLISIALANHELGVIQPISEVASVVKAVNQDRLSRGIKTPLYLHCDASQGFSVLNIQTSRLGVDLLTLNAGKIYGPKQVGLLWIKPGVVIKPRIVGGGQESGLRSGTENVAGVMGFARAAELSVKHRKSESNRLMKLRNKLQDDLVKNIPDSVISGDVRHRLANYLHISFPGVDGERLVFRLETDGISVATGSACAANKHTRSHVLNEIGLEPECADGSLRITLGKYSNIEGVNTLVDRLTEAVNNERSRGR